MKSILRLNAENCQNCFKCIRECPLKAIEFKENHTKIIEEECILCGKCMEICPQNAKYVRQNVDEVKTLLAEGKPVCLSLAPSYTGWYGNATFAQLSAALKKLGFARVEETAIGAAEVTKEYEELLASGKMKNVIATSCSSMVMLIERHFPALIGSLAPVSSPMMAHARLMREAYGDIRVVFVGPCLSKMQESEDPLAGGLVDQVLTFEDIDLWMKEAGIRLEEEDPDATGVAQPLSRIYPKQEGIIKTMLNNFHGYTPISVDGHSRCLDFFGQMQSGEVDHLFVEANICIGGCIGGPIMEKHRKNVIHSLVSLKSEPQPMDRNPSASASLTLLHPRVFANRQVETKKPTEEQIREILASIGKTTKEQELNCGSCGYPTCRDKAVAVFNGKADVTMCLPFLREQAENMSATIISNSPNGIIAFDTDLCVTEINPKGQELFGVDLSILGEMIPALYGETAFDEAREENRLVVKKVEGATPEIIVEFTVMYLASNRMYIAFAKDISEQEHSREELSSLRMSTVDVAQNVIEKQMRVAQEIASLLGETTAETKMALTRLKKSITEISSKD